MGEEMGNSNARKRLKPGAGDVAHTLAKATISGIPVVGAPAAEIFSAIIVPPLSKRRDEWIESLTEGLKRLEEKVEGFKIEELSKRDMFITTVMHASQAAIRNHQEEKLEALRNAVLNAALPNPPEEDIQLMFLNFVDTLTAWHLRVLKFFDNPQGWTQEHDVSYDIGSMGTPSTVLEQGFPELRQRRDFYEQLVKDLSNRGLMNPDSLYPAMTPQGMFPSCTTAMGRQFIQFVTSPLAQA